MHEAHETLTTFQGWGKEGLTDLASFPVWATYGQGMHFIDAQITANGEEYVWTQVLPNPPKRTAMLYRPDTYEQPAPTAKAFATALDGPINKINQEHAMVGHEHGSR